MVRERVTAFGESGNVPISLAQDLIRSSAFWVDHPQGIIHPVPKWADHIVKGPQGWEVRFGGEKSNKFLIERAILLSKETILDEIIRAQNSGQEIDSRLLFRRLITCTRKSVANYENKTFDYYTGGAEPDVKSQGFYTEDSFIRSKILILINRERFGLIPPSKDVWKGFMKLAVHAIKVDAFVERMLQLAGLNTVE